MTGEEYYQIISKNVLREISNATASLYSDLIYGIDKNTAKEIVEEAAAESKKIVNCYMNEQKNTLLKLIDLN